MMEGDCEVLDWLRYYLSLNSLPLHYHYGGCRPLAANPAVRNAENSLTDQSQILWQTSVSAHDCCQRWRSSSFAGKAGTNLIG